MSLNSSDQSIDVFVEVGILTHLYTVAEGQRLKGIWQICLTRHDRSAHQHRNHRNVARQRGLNLNSHQITRILESQLSFGFDIEPSVTDDGKKDIAFTHKFVNVVAKVETEWNRIDILVD